MGAQPRTDDHTERRNPNTAIRPTESGTLLAGSVRSTAGMSVLLYEGIGDTIRVSLTPTPGGDRSEEVRCGQQILQSLGIRSFMPQVTSCPGCGRTTSTYFQELAERIQGYLVASMPEWKKQYPGVEELKLAVMGCIVNGPGEMADADFGYVGGAPGKVNLYVGKNAVKFNIPEAEAVDRLQRSPLGGRAHVPVAVDDAGSCGK